MNAFDEPSKPSQDLAEVEHWDGIYAQAGRPTTRWEPSYYASRALGRVLLGAIRQSGAKSILEVGCGNSYWLGYLARAAGVETVAGLDYSPRGCELARERLAAEGVVGEIFQADLFHLDVAERGGYDFVYSLGLVEHYAELPPVVAALASLVKPGGMLFTEVPDLKALYGWATWLLYPELFAKHRPCGRQELMAAHRQAGLVRVLGGHAGICCFAGFSLPAQRPWLKPFWPLGRAVQKFGAVAEKALETAKCYTGVPGLAQYLYVTGCKPSL